MESIVFNVATFVTVYLHDEYLCMLGSETASVHSALTPLEDRYIGSTGERIVRTFIFERSTCTAFDSSLNSATLEPPPHQ